MTQRQKYHIFFNADGYHNHLVHGLLTLYGLGAPKEAIEKHYKENAYYQRKLPKARESIIRDMKSPELLKIHLGKGKYYPEFLVFFQNEIGEKGWENVLNEYLFSGDGPAEDLLGRLYAGMSSHVAYCLNYSLKQEGFFHPFIHLGFGVEFKQPAIIAEALAQAAVHENSMSSYLFTTEKESTMPGTKTIPDLIEDIRNDRVLSNAAKWEDGNKVRDGVLKRAANEMIHHAKQWTVSEDNLNQKTAEMINATVYFTAAAQRPRKEVYCHVPWVAACDSKS